MVSTKRKLGEAEERAMTAQRNLRLARDALRVKTDFSNAADAAATATSALTLSPGSSCRFPQSNHDLPLAASPALRAPPPVRWGSGPVPPGAAGVSVSAGSDVRRRSTGGSVVSVGDGGSGGGVGKGVVGGTGGDRVAGGGGGGGAGGSELLVGRTQEMGVRFALDTLKYSEDEEVVVFMLQLVQVGGVLDLFWGGEGGR